MNIARLSARSEPSDIHASGKAASSAAAMMPTRSLAIARPVRPTSTIVAAPSAHDQSKWLSVLVIPSAEGMARKTTYNGGCSADSTTRPSLCANGEMKPFPSASRLALSW